MLVKYFINMQNYYVIIIITFNKDYDIIIIMCLNFIDKYNLNFLQVYFIMITYDDYYDYLIYINLLYQVMVKNALLNFIMVLLL